VFRFASCLFSFFRDFAAKTDSLQAITFLKSIEICHGRKAMSFIQDFLSFGSLGVLAVILIGIGITGCLVHRSSMRLAACGCISIAGLMLLLDASAKLHHTHSPLAFVIVLGGIAIGSIVRSVLHSGKSSKVDSA
jgi:hypothetical protein